MKEEKLELGDIGESGCPCGEFVAKGYRIKSHCWRTGKCCEYSGVHYSWTEGFKSIAKVHAMRIQDYISESWSTDVALVNDGRMKSSNTEHKD